MPPAALTPIPGPTVRRISSTSWAGAPPRAKPGEGLTKWAPAGRAHQQARTFSSSVRSAHSRMTFTSAPPVPKLRDAARTTPRMSCSTSSSSPDLSAPTLMTISISCAPSFTASSVSAAFTVASVAPRGKPTTVQTFTGVSRRAAAAVATQVGFTTTVAKPNCFASAQSLRISSRVASGLSRVWSISAATSAGIWERPGPAARRQAPAATTLRALSAQVSTQRVSQPGQTSSSMPSPRSSPRGRPPRAGKISRVTASIRISSSCSVIAASGLDRGEDADVRQVAVALAVVEPVTDHESVGNLEADVVHRDFLEAAGGLVEERGDLERLGLARLQDAVEVVEGQAGVEDVFDDDDVQALDGVVEVLGDAG